MLEPYYRHYEEGEDEVNATVIAQLEQLKASLRDLKFSDPKDRRIHPDRIKPVWMDVGSIKLGWVQVDGMAEAIAQQAEGVPEAANYDLDTAVISADTERRILRYVFPRKGAVSVSVEHSDRPGAMGRIADALAGNKLNILSSLLRRGSAPAHKAEVVVVVEPIDGVADQSEVESRAHAALADLDVELRVNVDVSGPVAPEEVLYPRRPHEIAVRPSIALEAEIRAIREELPADKVPIFISRRFVDLGDDYSRDVVEELKAVLAQYGCVAVEAKPRGGDDRTAPDAVKARMWASDAAILLVVSTPADKRQFSENLAHECGFMQGQGKPLLPLVQEDQVEGVIRNANLQGLQLSTFSKESALNRHRPNSIHDAIRQWVAAEFPDQFEDAVASG